MSLSCLDEFVMAVKQMFIRKRAMVHLEVDRPFSMNREENSPQEIEPDDGPPLHALRERMTSSNFPNARRLSHLQG